MTNKSFAGLTFDNSYSKLPRYFFSLINPSPVKKPKLIKLNESLASEFGLDIKKLKSKQGVEFFAGNYIPNQAEPIANVYAGHQFGHFVPQLGDGRAVLIGEIINANGKRYDIQLKGSGQTPYSRRGDGRSALGPVIREYIMSEAMHALGIKTTRALAMVSSGEPVFRQEILPGGVFTRIASSHIRVGTFQYFAATGNVKAIKELADYAIKRHYLACSKQDNPYQGFLAAVIKAQAELITSWMMKGFIHGVMNTDNMSICGETIDYGPCAFMDIYNPNTKFSSIDERGRYAFGNQASIASWNLARLADCLITILAKDKNQAIQIATAELKKFPELFNKLWLKEMRKKFGLDHEQPEDLDLILDFLKLLEQDNGDYNLSFRYLCYLKTRGAKTRDLSKLFKNKIEYQKWQERYLKRIAMEPISQKERFEKMLKVNPAYIPRNHLVEEAIHTAIYQNDFSKMHKLIRVMRNPYQEKSYNSSYMLPPKEVDGLYRTFCGT